MRSSEIKGHHDRETSSAGEPRELQERGTDVLYVTYDGLLEPLGRSRVVRQLERLAAEGLRIVVVSFEKPKDLEDRDKLETMLARLEAASIEWTALRHHRRPHALAMFWDIVRGSVQATRLARSRRPAWIHARSYVAGLMALSAKLSSDCKLLFDMRGFWPEEQVELGLFATHGALYRLSKRFERALLEASDHVVVLTHKAKAVLRDREAGRRLTTNEEVRETPVTVIPSCVDLGRFQPMEPDEGLAARYGLAGKLVIGNIGTFNARYLVNDMFRFAAHLRRHRPETVFVYLTGHDPAAVRKAARSGGLADEALLVVRVEPDDVPRWLSLFRLGVFFVRPSYAAKASSFTKLGEFLASGVPVATNTGLGDVDELLGPNKCGLLVSGLTDRGLDAAARRLLPLLEGARVQEDTRDRCRALASKELSLEDGVRRYQAVYETAEIVDDPEKTKRAKDLTRVAEAS